MASWVTYIFIFFYYFIKPSFENCILYLVGFSLMSKFVQWSFRHEESRNSRNLWWGKHFYQSCGLLQWVSTTSNLLACTFRCCSVDTMTHQQALQLQHDSLCKVLKNLEACPLLSGPISVQAPLKTRKLLDVEFVGHLSLRLPSTLVLKDNSLKWEITV